MQNRLFLTLVSLAIWSAAINSRAHTVWIEPMGNNLAVRFTEPGSDFETSPGHLDSLSSPIAFVIITNSPVMLEARKKADHFLLTGAEATNVACLETIFTVRGGRKPYFYARWQPAEVRNEEPFLTLDLVPTGKPGEVRAWFRGKPLGNIKATLRTPDQKEQELTADAKGFLRFSSTQSGQHLLTIAHHREPLAGFHRGQSYKQISHNTALTWQQP